MMEHKGNGHMQPLTEQTAIALTAAIRDLTAAITGNSVPLVVPQKRRVDPDYLPGGVEWAKSATTDERREYNRALMKKRRAGKR